MRVLVTSDWQLTVAQTNCSASIFNFGTAEMAASQKFGYPALDILCTLHEGQSQVAESVPECHVFTFVFLYCILFMVLLFPYHLDHTYVLWLAVGASRQKPQKKGGPSAQLDKQAEDAVTCHFT